MTNNLICNILGVSGTGKSTIASEIASKVEGVYVFSTDLLKDGLRFVINSGRELSNLTKQDATCLKHPSKKLSSEDAIRAAYIVGNLNSYFCNILFNEFPDISIICEGFFIPKKDSPAIFLEKSIDWFYKVSLDRTLKRYGEYDYKKAESYALSLFYLQKLFKQELKLLTLEYLSTEFDINGGVNVSITLIGNGRIINPSHFAEKIFKYVGLRKVTNSDIQSFQEGVMHAYRRTTDLK